MSPTETTTETTTKTLFTLPPHLQTALSALSAAGIAPPSLQTELERTLSAAEEEVYEDEGEVAAAREIVAGAKAKARPTLRDSTLGSGPGGSNGDKGEQEGEKGEKEPTDGDGIEDKEPEAETKPRPTRRPATIDGALLDEIARWAGMNEASLKRARLDPADYGTISLLAGTTLYLAPRQRALARVAEMNSDKPNPFLPHHLSPLERPPSVRSLFRTISTVLNVLFSIFGAGGAAYAAAVATRWERYHAVLLAIAVGLVVAVADLGLIAIYNRNSRVAKKKEAEVRVRMSRGSGAKVEEKEKEGGGEGVGEGENPTPESVIPPKKANIRLRRRAL